MNRWTTLSVELANQRNYLDQLFKVYPAIPETIRDIDKAKWDAVEQAFQAGDDKQLIMALLCLKLFPVKDPYVAFLRRDVSAIDRNPGTIARLCGRLREIGLDGIWERCSQPKEMNRQIGPLFRNWLEKRTLGLQLRDKEDFLADEDDAILRGSDRELGAFAREHLNYVGDKGLDLVARIGGRYVIGEAKFLTDYGGHQKTQFNDALVLLRRDEADAVKVAILDGVLYIRNNSSMYRALAGRRYNIMSALVLREYLHSL